MNNSYFYIEDEDDKYWIETDENKNALRQIWKEKNCIHLSCFEDCLAEGVIDEFEGLLKISKLCFEEIWNFEIKKYRNTWISIKNMYKPGSKIEGKVLYFYPQGIIIKGIDCIFLYKGKKEFKLHENVLIEVKGYDDDNMWIVCY